MHIRILQVIQKKINGGAHSKFDTITTIIFPFLLKYHNYIYIIAKKQVINRFLQSLNFTSYLRKIKHN